MGDLSAYANAGYGDLAVGFGERPAVLVVDFQRAFTDPAFAGGRSPHIHAAVKRTATLLEHARVKGIPVAACAAGWNRKEDMPYWKVSSVYQGMYTGEPGLELDPLIYHPGDLHFTKVAPSIFFGTSLQTFLTRHRIDTTIITGCTTSGCVRASINDAFSYGYRVMVAEDCCGDQDESGHKSNLADVGRRYADIVSAQQCIDWIETLDIDYGRP